MSSVAGAQGASQWNVQGNGGFVSLSLLNTIQVAGGGSEADASNAPVAEASGTGACLSTAATSNPCPTSATSSLAGDALDSTQDAVAKGDGTSATSTGPNSCPIPIDTGLLDVDVVCGTASASEDGGGNPTASGSGAIATASLSLSLTDVLQAILGGPLPSASSLCADAPAASATPGSDTSQLSAPVQSVLRTVNGILPAVNQILATLGGAGGALSGAVTALLTDLVSYNPSGNLLSCDSSPPGTTASAKVGVLNLGLLSGLMGGIGLNVGDVSVTGSSTVASPAVATASAAATPATPVAVPAAVPNVTSVHTGEYWAGILPVILLAGLGGAGIALIARPRIASCARSLHPITRRRGSR